MIDRFWFGKTFINIILCRMGRCCNKFCNNKHQKSGVRFHSFPSNLLFQRLWLAAIGRQDLEQLSPKELQHRYVCEVIISWRLQITFNDISNIIFIIMLFILLLLLFIILKSVLV